MTEELNGGHTFAGLLHARRAAAGLTQEQLAERSGLGIRTIRNLERGRVRRPHRESIDLLATALGLPAVARDELARAGGQLPLPADWPPAGAGVPVPRQLPPAIQHFAGRVDELKLLTGLLNSTSIAGTVVLTAIDGTAGIGKTALAVYWAHRVAGRFPDGQLYVNLRGFDPGGPPLAPGEAICGFLDALGVPPAQIPPSLEAQAARYRSLLAGKRMLVLLDNACDAAQVRPLLPGSPGCFVVVTSRARLLSLVAAEGAHPLTLGLFTVEEGRELLARRLGTARVSSEHAAADDLIGLCAGLPVALNIVAARAADDPARPLAGLARQLGKAQSRLDLLDGGDEITNVRAVFSWSYQYLGASAARLFRLLGGVHPGPDISAPAAASLACVPLADARRALDELAAARLATEQPAGRFSCHDLLRAYAAEQARALDGEAERHAALRRVLDHYLHTTRRAAQLLAPARDMITLAAPQPGTEPEALGDEAAALTWLEAEYPVLLAAITAAVDADLDDYVWQLAWGLSDFLPRCGHWQAFAMTQGTALAAAQRLGNAEAQARAHAQLGYAHGMLAHYQAASSHLHSALRLYRQLGDRRNEAVANIMFAHVLGWQDRNSEARDRAREALEISRTGDHPTAHAGALNALGWYSAMLGGYEEALRHSLQALDLLRKLGERYGQAATLDSLGFIHRHLGHYPRAIDYYQQALRLFGNLGDRYKQASTLTDLGDAHLAYGNVAAARTCWGLSLSVLADLNHPDTDTVRDKLSRIARTGDVASALPHTRAP